MILGRFGFLAEKFCGFGGVPEVDTVVSESAMYSTLSQHLRLLQQQPVPADRNCSVKIFVHTAYEHPKQATV